jgi:purine-cytosine permease-like protein
VWLAILGASIASVAQSADPAKLVSSVFGGVVAVLVMLLVLHGPIATNILNVYSSALAGRSGGIKLSRPVLGLIAGVVGYAVTLYFVHAPDFAANFDNWMSSLVLWMSPWAGVVLADFYLLRRKQIDVAQLYADPKTSIYGDINWVGIVAFLLGLACGWLFEFGLVGPLQGYISRHFLSGGDLSWLVGIVVAGGVYLIGMRGRASAASAQQLPAAANQPTA